MEPVAVGAHCDTTKVVLCTAEDGKFLRAAAWAPPEEPKQFILAASAQHFDLHQGVTIPQPFPDVSEIAFANVEHAVTKHARGSQRFVDEFGAAAVCAAVRISPRAPLPHFAVPGIARPHLNGEAVTLLNIQS